MGALRAIIADTWRQSRQQVVFLIMLVILALTALTTVGLAHTVQATDEAGASVERVALHGWSASDELLTEAWAGLYSRTIMAEYMDEGETVDPFSEEGQELQQKLFDFAAVEAQTEPKRRGVETLIWGVSLAVYMTSMMLFIAACAGYFPALLETGAVDIVLAKPLERWQIFLGKYLGGMALFTAALLGTYALLFVGLGLRTGVWHPAIFMVMPLQVLSAGTLFALIALLGVIRGSTALAMIVGYGYYLIVDKIMQVLLFAKFGSEEWQATQKLLRAGIPNFVSVRDTALMSIINAPAIDWQPVLVMFTWMLLSLGIGYWVFHRRDF